MQPSPPQPRPTITQRIVEAGASHPVLTLAITAICIALSILAIGRTRIDGSLTAMVKGESRAAESLARITSDYRSIDELLVLAEIPPSDSATPEAARAKLLAFADRLSTTITSDPDTAPLCRYVRFHADANIDRFVRTVMIPAGLYYLTDAEFDDLLHRLDPAEMSRQFARNESLISAPGPAAGAAAKAILKDPLRLHEFLAGRLQSAGIERADATLLGDSAIGPAEFSSDGRSLLIRVGGTQPINNLDFSKQLTSAITRLIEKARPDTLHVHLSGGYAIASYSATSIRSDSISNTIWSVPLIPVLCFFLYRRLLAPILITIAAGAGLLIAFGLHAVFVHTITPLSAVIAATLAGLSVDYGIHTISHYQSAREQGLSSFQSSSHTARAIGESLLAACFTTIFGFMSVYFAKFTMLRDFAILGSLGLALAMVAILTVMPAILRLIDRKPRLPPSSARFRRIGSLSWISTIATSRPRLCISICLSLALCSAIAITLAPSHFPTYESDLSVMHPSPNPPLEASRIIDKRFGGMTDSLLVELTASNPDDLITTSYQVAQALQSPAAAAHVSGTLGLSTLLPNPKNTAPSSRRAQAIAAINPDRILADFDAAAKASIFDPAAFKQYREFLGSLLRPSHPPTLADLQKFPDLALQLLPSPAATPPRALQLVRLNQRIDDRDSREAIVTSARESLTNVPSATLTGLPVVGHDLESSTRRDLPRYIAISMALVFTWLFIVFRSLKFILLAFIPVGFATIVMFGFMIAFDIRFNLASAMAVPLLAGIAVDSGVFLVVVARQHRAQGRAALLREYQATVQAIVGATGTSVLGFGTLFWTSTPAIRSLGITSAVGIIAGAIAALFLLMPLMLLLTPTSPRASEPTHQ